MCSIRSLVLSPYIIVIVAFLVPCFALSAAAAPTDPVMVEPPPIGEGDAFVPGARQLEDLPRAYVEEEFLISGTATLFNYANDPPLGPTDLTPIVEGGTL